jgi:hypothetical protein
MALEEKGGTRRTQGARRVNSVVKGGRCRPGTESVVTNYDVRCDSRSKSRSAVYCNVQQGQSREPTSHSVVQLPISEVFPRPANYHGVGASHSAKFEYDDQCKFVLDGQECLGTRRHADE